jgi:hypothetical protein
MRAGAKRRVAGNEIVDLEVEVDLVNAFQMVLQVAEFDDDGPMCRGRRS